jgi:hypothetical protein
MLFDQPLNLQLGRTFLCLTLQKPFSLFSCICSSKKPEKDTDYQILNSKAINFENYNIIKELNDKTIELETDNMKETENNNADDEDKQLEMANTQTKIDFHAIKDQLQKDIDSLRAVRKFLMYRLIWKLEVTNNHRLMGMVGIIGYTSVLIR